MTPLFTTTHTNPNPNPPLQPSIIKIIETPQFTKALDIILPPLRSQLFTVHRNNYYPHLFTMAEGIFTPLHCSLGYDCHPLYKGLGYDDFALPQSSGA